MRSATVSEYNRALQKLHAFAANDADPHRAEYGSADLEGRRRARLNTRAECAETADPISFACVGPRSASGAVLCARCLSSPLALRNSILHFITPSEAKYSTKLFQLRGCIVVQPYRHSIARLMYGSLSGLRSEACQEVRANIHRNIGCIEVLKPPSAVI
eukprot:7384550-Prymnesium_polylepis.1